jgi:hypothetical protein
VAVDAVVFDVGKRWSCFGFALMPRSQAARSALAQGVGCRNDEHNPSGFDLPEHFSAAGQQQKGTAP